MVGYKDIYDLENTLLSFEYTPGDAAGGKSGRTTLRLVNPTRNVENILFSIYKAMQPRAQTPIDGADDEDAELSKNLDVANTSYIRWGYMSDDPDTKNPVTRALSEIHKMRLIEVDYDINNNQDRIITINFVDTLDLDYRGMMTEDSQGDGELITFPIHHSDYKLRKMSSIVQELILQCLNGSSDYELLGRLSDEQETAINQTLDSLIANRCLKAPLISKTDRKSIKEEGAKSVSHAGFQLTEARFMPVNGEKWNYVRDQSPYEVPLLMALGDYVRNLLGGDISFRSEGEDEFTPETVTSKGQSALNRGANNNNGSPDDPNPQGTDQASAQAQAAALKSKYPVIPLGESDWNPLSLNIMLGPPPWPCTVPYYIAKELPDKFQVDFTPIEIKEIIKEGKALLISAGAWKLAEGKGLDDQQQYVGFPRAPSPWAEGFPPVDARLFDLQNYKEVLELQADTEHANNLEAAKHLPGDTTPKMQGYADTISQNQPATVPKPLPVSRSHMAQFKGDSNLMLRCKGYIDRINTTILGPITPLINMVKLEYSTVPEQEQSHVESVLGRKLDWDNSTGAIIIGENKFFMKLFSWRRDINSFPIEVESDDTQGVARISISTGFSQRKDNIVTSVGFKQDQAFLATALRQAPIVNQKLYNITKRFEDPAYRDVVAEQLTLQPVKGAGTGSQGSSTLGAPTSAPTPADGLNPEEVTVGVRLPDAVALAAISAAAKYSSEEGDTSSKDVEKMKEQIAADLRWITQNNFLDVFFPKTSSPGKHATPLSIKGEPDNIASSSYYRTIAVSPLTNLQTFTSASSDSEALLLASKMAVLRQLQSSLRQVDVTMLGVPEMDILSNEIARRAVGLWVAEPRTPGTFHWMTGVYLIRGFTHKIDSNGYTMSMSLFPKQPQVAEDLRKFQYAFLKD